MRAVRGFYPILLVLFTASLYSTAAQAGYLYCKADWNEKRSTYTTEQLQNDIDTYDILDVELFGPDPEVWSRLPLTRARFVGYHEVDEEYLLRVVSLDEYNLRLGCTKDRRRLFWQEGREGYETYAGYLPLLAGNGRAIIWGTGAGRGDVSFIANIDQPLQASINPARVDGDLQVIVDDGRGKRTWSFDLQCSTPGGRSPYYSEERERWRESRFREREERLRRHREEWDQWRRDRDRRDEPPVRVVPTPNRGTPNYMVRLQRGLTSSQELSRRRAIEAIAGVTVIEVVNGRIMVHVNGEAAADRIRSLPNIESVQRIGQRR